MSDRTRRLIVATSVLVLLVLAFVLFMVAEDWRETRKIPLPQTSPDGIYRCERHYGQVVLPDKVNLVCPGRGWSGNREAWGTASWRAEHPAYEADKPYISLNIHKLDRESPHGSACRSYLFLHEYAHIHLDTMDEQEADRQAIAWGAPKACAHYL